MKITWWATSGAIVIGASLILLPAPAAVAVALVLAAWPLWHHIDLWRIGVSVSILASVLRTGHFADALESPAWYALQFGPLLLTCTYLVLAPRKGPQQSRSSATMLFLAAAAALSALWSASPRHTLSEAAMLLLVLAFAALTRIRRWTNQKVVTGDLVVVFGTIVVVQLLGTLAFAAGLPWARLWGARFQGAFSNPNYTGILAALGLAIGAYLILASKRSTFALVLAEASLLPPLILSGSRGALLGTAVAIVYAAIASRDIRIRRMVIGTVALGGFAILAAKPSTISLVTGMFSRGSSGEDVTSGRVGLWSNLIQVWRENPFIGIGYSSIQELAGQRGLAAHNLFLQFLVELGLVGLGLALLAFGSLWVRRARSGPEIALVGGLLAVIIVECTEASLTGAGNSISLTAWLVCVGATVSQPSVIQSSAPNGRRTNDARSQSEQEFTAR